MEAQIRKRKSNCDKKKPANSSLIKFVVYKKHKPHKIYKYKGIQYESKEVQPIWRELRLKSQLCDGFVRCDDGGVFPVHRAILSVVSPYFKALFTNSINPNEAEVNEANVNAPGTVFNELLEYAYTGLCSVTPENVEKLFEYSDQYGILGVIQLCSKYLAEQLGVDNCFRIVSLADRYYCKSLSEAAHQYIRYNFHEIFHENNEFLDLQHNALIDLLKDDHLNVRSEINILEAIKKWINYSLNERIPHLLELLKCIRLGSNSFADCISEISEWSLIQGENACNQYIDEAIVLIKLNLDEIDLARNYIFRPRVPYDIVFAVGGWSAGSPTNFIETYDVRADRWFLSKDTDSVPRAYHGLCALRGLIYMIGGFDGNEYFNTVRCFNPVNCVWSECACMYYPRCYVSVVQLDEKIYAMGGYNGRLRMSSVERYDPVRNQWELIPNMQKQRSDASAAAVIHKIYVVGGFNGQEVMRSAEVFDTSTNQWSYIKPMLSPRSGVSLVAYKHALYALGGFNGYNRLTSAEKLLLDSDDSWTEIAEMFKPRSNFATAILDDFIYVIGGFNGSSTINFVEYYDPDSNEWADAASMNLNRSALGACIISGLPNAKYYTYLGCNQKELGPDASTNVVQ